MSTTKVIDIRGRKLGGETPLICSPLVGRTRERVLAEAAIVAAKKPDVIEWRVDYFDAIGDTAAVLDTGKALRAVAGDAPIIFTRRSTKEGGEPIALDDEGVVRLYDAVGASRLVDFLDFEMSNDAGSRAPRRDGRARERDPRHPVVSQFRLHAGTGFPRPAIPRGRAARRRRRQGRGDAARPRRRADAAGGDRRRPRPRRAFR